MASLTSIYKLPTPDYSDGAAGPDAFKALADRVEAVLPRRRAAHAEHGAINKAQGMQDTGILMPPGSGYLEMFRVTVPVTTIGYCDIHAAIVSTTEAPVTNSPNAGGTYLLEVAGVTYDIFRWHTLTKGAHFLSILHGTYDLPPTVTSFMFRVLGQCDIQSNSGVRGIHYRYDWSQIGALRT